jgi:Protein of unknown function (DUF3102)
MNTLPHDRSISPADTGSTTERIVPQQSIVRENFSNGQHPVALVDMSVGQLADAFNGLTRLEKEYENMSGICATLKGLILIEAKTKLGHGNYRTWLKENFPKSVKTAERYKRLAEAFGKSDSTVAFQTLTQGLTASLEALRARSLDLSHPIVAKVAQWVNGRGAYQLMLDFPGAAGPNGGNNRKKLTPEEQHAQFLEDAKNDFTATITGLDGLVDDERWKAPSITDAMLEASVELAREFAIQATAWLKTPKKDRLKIDILEDAAK